MSYYAITLSLFWIPGILLAIRIILGSDEPVKALTILCGLTIVEAFFALIFPFILNRGGTIYHISFLFDKGWALGVVSVFRGGGLWVYSFMRKRPLLTAVPASLFITTAFVPIFFFGLSEKVATLFEVKWSY